MASNVNPHSAGMVTDDPKFNQRYLQVDNFGGLNSLFSGTGVPADAAGQDGDLFSDLTAPKPGTRSCTRRKPGPGWRPRHE